MIKPDRFLPYSRQIIDEQDIKRVVDVLNNPFITQGPLMPHFEEKLAEYCGARFAVLFPNGSIALQMAANAAGLGAHDKVITTSNSFIATANAALYCGSEIRFADIDSGTFNIDIDSVSSQFDDQVKAVITVDFAGEPVDLPLLRKKLGSDVILISDACHSLGGDYLDEDGTWHKVGDCRFADMTVFSFHPAKNMTTAEGGAVLTNSEDFYERLKLLQNNGITKNTSKWVNKSRGFTEFKNSDFVNPWYYEMLSLGQNCRMTELQCALGIEQLKKLDTYVEQRRELSQYYRDLFNDSPLQYQLVSNRAKSGCHLFVLQIDFASFGTSRARIMIDLKEAGIGTQVHYIPIHYQPYYQKIGFADVSLPNCESYYEKALSIPLFPDLKKSEADYVASTLFRLIGL